MEGQKFEITEDPSQALPERSPMGPFFVELVFETFQNSGRNRFLAAILANICLRNSQADLGLDAAQFCCWSHTSFDKINDSVVSSERGELVRAPTSPWCTALTLRPVICGGRRSGFC